MYRPPGPYKDFLKEFADFLSDLLVNVDKALIVRYFTFTFMHLADAFIQSDLQCIQAIHFFFISMCVPWELNPQPFALLTQCSTTEPQKNFNIHVDNINDALGLAFTDLMNSFGVKQNITRTNHRF